MAPRNVSLKDLWFDIHCFGEKSNVDALKTARLFEANDPDSPTDTACIVVHGYYADFVVWRRRGYWTIQGLIAWTECGVSYVDLDESEPIFHAHRVLPEVAARVARNLVAEWNDNRNDEEISKLEEQLEQEGLTR